jgi:hypothetical protein
MLAIRWFAVLSGESRCAGGERGWPGAGAKSVD